MGFLLLQETQTFIPRKAGIPANSMITVIAIGGGAGGGNCVDTTTTVKGGRSGEPGEGRTNSSGTPLGGGGGPGAGFGAGAGGAGCVDLGWSGGSGGGAGEVVTKTFLLEDPDEEIAVTIAQKVAAQTAGQSTSFGSYVTAKGGAPGQPGGAYDTSWDEDYEIATKHVAFGGLSGNGIDRGGRSTSGDSYKDFTGGGGGAGGYQIGLFLQGGHGGNAYADSTTDGEYNGGGAGAGHRNNNSTAQSSGGPGGGGDGGAAGEFGEYGLVYMHSGLDNSGAILLFW